MLTIQGIFDGQKIEIVDKIPFNEKKKVLITFLDDMLFTEKSEITESKHFITKRILGLNRGEYFMSDDFDAPLPDSFWLGEE